MITRFVSFWLLVAIIVAVALVFYRVMSGFLLPLFLAALLVVIFKPLHEYLLSRVKQPMVAALMATILVVVIVFVPMIWSLTMAANEAISVAKQFDANRFTRQIHRIQVMLDLDLPLVEETLDLDPLFDDLLRPAGAEEAGPPAGDEHDPATPPPPALARQPALPPVDYPGTLEVIRRRVDEIDRQLPRVEPPSLRPELRQINDQIARLRDDLRRSQARFEAGDDEGFREATGDAHDSFDRVKSLLPSGVVRVGLKGLINPNPGQVREWKERVETEIKELLVPAGKATAGFAAKLIFGTIIMIVSVFFFFADGQKMTATVMRLIPLDMRHQEELLRDFGHISRAVVLATLVSAVVQGVLAGIGFYFAGTGSVALLMLLTMVFAMIPFVGAMSVWVPVCAWMGFVDPRGVWPAILLAIYCAIVVSQSDNVVKPLILKGQSNIHPLLALLSILGGVQALGPVGILVGPMVVVFLQTLLNILHREMTSLERPANSTGPPTSISVPAS